MASGDHSCVHWRQILVILQCITLRAKQLFSFLRNDSNHDVFLYMRKNISWKYYLPSKSKENLSLQLWKSTYRCDISNLSCLLHMPHYMYVNRADQ